MNERVCAVVVTFNRKELLVECLTAIQRQTRPTDELVVINNASTDGTAELLRERFKGVRVLETEANYGGAGGFHAGIRWAHEAGYDWIWVMDDDACPHPDALERLFAAGDLVDPAFRPGILASQVVWEDGRPHPMNHPQVESRRLDFSLAAGSARTVAIRSVSFVSIAIHRSCIDAYGLPIADYFIWNDDVEYTARVLNHRLGILVPDSVVVHKTKSPYVPSESAGPRFYYEVRNKLWMTVHSPTFSMGRKMWLLRFMLSSTFRYLKLRRFSPIACWTVARAGAAGVFSRPRELDIRLRDVTADI